MATLLLLLAVYILGGFTGGWLVYEIKTAPYMDDDV